MTAMVLTIMPTVPTTSADDVGLEEPRHGQWQQYCSYYTADIMPTVPTTCTDIVGLEGPQRWQWQRYCWQSRRQFRLPVLTLSVWKSTALAMTAMLLTIMPTVPTTSTDIVGLEGPQRWQWQQWCWQSCRQFRLPVLTLSVWKDHSVGNDSNGADSHADSSDYLYWHCRSGSPQRWQWQRCCWQSCRQFQLPLLTLSVWM